MQSVSRRVLSLLAVVLACALVVGCGERQTPALTKEALEQVSQLETLQEIEGVLGAGLASEPPLSYQPRPGFRISRWVKWTNGRLNYSVGLDADGNILQRVTMERNK